jgi:hypothetical protein
MVKEVKNRGKKLNITVEMRHSAPRIKKEAAVLFECSGLAKNQSLRMRRT